MDINRKNKIFDNISVIFKPDSLLPGTIAGTINGILIISIQFSFATMLFPGDLSMFLSKGIGLTLLGTFIIVMILAIKSTPFSNTAIVQDGPVVILSISTLAIAAGMTAPAALESVFYTIIVTLPFPP